MEPVTTIEGIKLIHNPDESRNLLGSYYESLGFQVVKAEPKPTNQQPASSTPPSALAGK